MNQQYNPSHCPNPNCRNHTIKPDNDRQWFVRRGYRQLRQNDAQKTALFICKGCGRCFSENSFRRDYYEKVFIDTRDIIKTIHPSITLKDWAEALNTTRPTLKLRLIKFCWTLVEQLEHSQYNVATILYDIQKRMAEGHNEFVLLRLLILRLRRLLLRGYGRCFFGWNRQSWGDDGEPDGGKQNLLTAIWYLVGRWYYPMPHYDWYPAYPSLWQQQIYNK